MPSYLERVTKVVADIADVEESVLPGAPISDYLKDSIDVAEALAVLMETLSVELELEELLSCQTVHDVALLIESKKA